MDVSSQQIDSSPNNSQSYRQDEQSCELPKQNRFAPLWTTVAMGFLIVSAIISRPSPSKSTELQGVTPEGIHKNIDPNDQYPSIMGESAITPISYTAENPNVQEDEELHRPEISNNELRALADAKTDPEKQEKIFAAMFELTGCDQDEKLQAGPKLVANYLGKEGKDVVFIVGIKNGETFEPLFKFFEGATGSDKWTIGGSYSFAKDQYPNDTATDFSGDTIKIPIDRLDGKATMLPFELYGSSPDGAKYYLGWRYTFATDITDLDVTKEAAKKTQAAEQQLAQQEAQQKAAMEKALTTDYVWPGVGEAWITHTATKIPREQVPASTLGRKNRNALQSEVFRNGSVHLMSLRNETVSFNIVVEAPRKWARQVEVQFDALDGPRGSKISAENIEKPEDLFHYPGNNIEVFAMGYLDIKGVSVLGWEDYYDARHAPEGFRLPYDKSDPAGRPTKGSGWRDRPFHDQGIPDICVPIEAAGDINIAPGTNQSFVVDVFVPKTALPGKYTGTIQVYEDRDSGDPQSQKPLKSIDVVLYVGDAELSDSDTVNFYTYTGRGLPARHGLGYEPDRSSADTAEALFDEQYKMFHRHRVGGVEDSHFRTVRGLHHPTEAQEHRINGQLYTKENGYDGPGIGIGERQFVPWIYGDSPLLDDGKSPEQIREQVAEFLAWFQKSGYKTNLVVPTIDEPDVDDRNQIARIREVAVELAALKKSAVNGDQLTSLVTMQLPDGLRVLPEVDTHASAAFITGESAPWTEALQRANQEGRNIVFYNGFRPGTGTLMTEGSGVDPMTLPLMGVKFGADWFFWDSTHYGERPTLDVFNTAQTFGEYTHDDPVKGQTGPTYSNGDGVLVYPGTDVVHRESSLGLPGPVASLRLKLIRDGVQFATLLKMAETIDPKATSQVIKSLISEALFETESVPSSRKGPRWVHREPGWNEDPNAWEAAKREIKKIIVRAAR